MDLDFFNLSFLRYLDVVCYRTTLNVNSVQWLHGMRNTARQSCGISSLSESAQSRMKRTASSNRT